MKKLVTLALSVALLAIILPQTIEYWPRSQTQDVAWIWMHEEELKELFRLASETPYTNITWVEGSVTQAGTRIGGDINWVKNPDLKQLVAAARNYDMSFLDLNFYRGSWTTSGYGGVWEILRDGESMPKLVEYNSYFQFGGYPEGDTCSNELIESIDRGRCHIKVFDDWLLHKEWNTRDYPTFNEDET